MYLSDHARCVKPQNRTCARLPAYSKYNRHPTTTPAPNYRTCRRMPRAPSLSAASGAARKAAAKTGHACARGRDGARQAARGGMVPTARVSSARAARQRAASAEQRAHAPRLGDRLSIDDPTPPFASTPASGLAATPTPPPPPPPPPPPLSTQRPHLLPPPPPGAPTHGLSASLNANTSSSKSGSAPRRHG
eukprot:scaffold11712_cov102-Isochrysis_galbana.AAC.2